MSAAIDIQAALEAVRLGEATGEHAAVLAAEVSRLDGCLGLAHAELATVRSPTVDPRRSMVDDPRVGDVWRWDGTIAKRVVAVLTPLEDGDEPRIALSGDERPTHVGWWVGQGWEPYEPAESAAAREALASVRAQRDAALEEQRRAVARLAEVSAERDQLAAEVEHVRSELLMNARAIESLHAEIDLLRSDSATHAVRQVIAERDRLLAVVIAQADAADGDTHEDALTRWMAACEATAALGRELRGGVR